VTKLSDTKRLRDYPLRLAARTSAVPGRFQPLLLSVGRLAPFAICHQRPGWKYRPNAAAPFIGSCRNATPAGFSTPVWLRICPRESCPIPLCRDPIFATATMLVSFEFEPTQTPRGPIARANEQETRFAGFGTARPSLANDVEHVVAFLYFPERSVDSLFAPRCSRGAALATRHAISALRVFLGQPSRCTPPGRRDRLSASLSRAPLAA